MEGRLIIFLACVAVTLIVNTVIIYMVFRIFGNLATKVTEGVHEFQTGASTRQWLDTLQSASENAVRVTGLVRSQLAEMEPALAKLQAEHSERLAKIDVRFKLIYKAMHFTAATVDRVVTWPIRNVQAAASFINGIFAFIRGRETGSGARTRQSR